VAQRTGSGPREGGRARQGTGIRAVAASPGAARLIAASLLAAVPAAAIGVLLILHTRHLGGSYALAGLAAGGYLFGAAVTGPAVGRLVDRHRIVPVLAACTAITVAALVAIAALTADSAPALLVAFAVVGGLAHPPVGAGTRTLLPSVISDEATLHSAYALESSALEISYIAGPALIGGLVAGQSTAAALLVAAAVLVIGTTWFAAQPAARAWRPATPVAVGRTDAGPEAGGDGRTKVGALNAPAVRVLIATTAAFSVSFGAIEVAVTAAASDLDARSLAGPLLAVWGIGSLVGGLVLATRAPPADAHRRLMLLLAALALGDLALVLTSGSWAFAALLPVSGLAIAPAFAVVNAMTGVSAVPGTSTEAFAWLGTGVSAGFSAGAALAGPAADHGGAPAAFGVSLGAVLVAMLIATASRPWLRTPAAAAAAAAASPVA
jgi:MFS family permease